MLVNSSLDRGERLRRLAGFVKALKEEGIIDFDIKWFKHRLKLQKYVFLARRYNFDLGYVFSLYIHGPYSPELADDYYVLSKENVPPIPVVLDKNFVFLIKRKSEWWLELAATIVLVKERYPGISEEEMKLLVKNSKPFATNDEIDEIIKELRAKKAID